jgi:hypothetical protein
MSCAAPCQLKPAVHACAYWGLNRAAVYGLRRVHFVFVILFTAYGMWLLDQHYKVGYAQQHAKAAAA